MTPEKRDGIARYRAEAVQREKERSERRHQDLLARVESIVSSYEVKNTVCYKCHTNQMFQPSDDQIQSFKLFCFLITLISNDQQIIWQWEVGNSVFDIKLISFNFHSKAFMK